MTVQSLVIYVLPQSCVGRGIYFFFFLKPCKLEEVINICIHKCPEIPIQRKKERQNKILNSVVDQKK